jgi:hypothetical protein
VKADRLVLVPGGEGAILGEGSGHGHSAPAVHSERALSRFRLWEFLRVDSRVSNSGSTPVNRDGTTSDSWADDADGEGCAAAGI